MNVYVSPKELAILFFIQFLDIVFLLFYFGVQDLYEGMQKKKKLLFSLCLL